MFSHGCVFVMERKKYSSIEKREVLYDQTWSAIKLTIVKLNGITLYGTIINKGKKRVLIVYSEI